MRGEGIGLSTREQEALKKEAKTSNNDPHAHLRAGCSKPKKWWPLLFFFFLKAGLYSGSSHNMQATFRQCARGPSTTNPSPAHLPKLPSRPCTCESQVIDRYCGSTRRHSEKEVASSSSINTGHRQIELMILGKL